MESEHFIGKVAQKAIIERDGKVLFVIDSRHTEKKLDLPGGRLHRDETPHEGLIREVKEELGVTVVVKESVDVNIYKSKDTFISKDGDPHYMIFFIAEMEDPHEPLTLQKGEIEEVRWISWEEIGTVPMHASCEKAVRMYFGRK